MVSRWENLTSFFREHDILEQFLRIFRVEIEEEKIFVYFTVNRILSHFIVHLSFFLSSFKLIFMHQVLDMNIKFPTPS